MRILLSCEGCDAWILEAYKNMFSKLAFHCSDIELYGTFSTSEKFDVIDKYNLIDYSKMPNDYLGETPAKDIINGAESGEVKTAHKYASWDNPEIILRKLYRFKRVCRIVQPDLVIVWNGMVDLRRNIREYLIKNNIPFFYAEKGYLPESWYVDELGVNCKSSLSKHRLSNKTENLMTEIEQLIHNIAQTGNSVWEQPSRINDTKQYKLELGLDKFSKLIFFPGQVDKDTNITQFSSFNSVVEAIELVMKSISLNEVLVVKVHPKSTNKSKKEIKALSEKYKNILILEDVNVWDVIEISDLVISINSTVAFEALLKKKKVILLGDSILKKNNIVKKIDQSDLSAQISKFFDMDYYKSVNYPKLLNFIDYLLNDFYLFRNKDIPRHFINKIRKKVGIVKAPKNFTKNELWNMFYLTDIKLFINKHGRKKLLEHMLLKKN